MTILSSKTERDLIGIDSLERAILFSALLLRSVLVQGDTENKENIKIYTEQKNISFIDFDSDKDPKPLISSLETVATIEIKLPYQSVEFLASGGDFIEYLDSLSDLIPDYLGGNLSPSESPLDISESPLVDTLEKYLSWSSITYIGLLEYYHGTSWKQLGSFSFLDSASVPRFDSKLSIVIDFKKYTETANLLESVKQTIKSLDPVSFAQNTTPPNNNLGFWDNLLFGDSVLIGDNNPPSQSQNNNNQLSQTIYPLSIPEDLLLSIQNNTQGGIFEKLLLTNEEKSQGWKVKNFTVNNNTYSVVDPQLNVSPNIIKINNSNNLEVTELKFYPDKISGKFASSFYSQEGLSFSGKINLEYRIERKIYVVNVGEKIDFINKKITLEVLPQIDFIGKLQPNNPNIPPTEIQLAEEKLIYFEELVNLHFIFPEAIRTYNFLKSANTGIIAITINGNRYTNWTNIDLTDWQININSNGEFTVIRFSPEAETINLTIEIQDNNQSSEYYQETQEISIEFTFRYLPIYPSANLLANNSDLNTQFLSVGDLENLISSTNLFSSTATAFNYQWNYRKITANDHKIWYANTGELPDYGTFEGVIRLEDPKAIVLIKPLSASSNYGWKFTKVADMNFISTATDNNSEYLFNVTVPKTQPNWDNGLVATHNNFNLKDFDGSIWEYQTKITKQSINLNLQDLHFAVTWYVSGSNYVCRLFLNGNFISEITINQKPRLSIECLKVFKWYKLLGYNLVNNPNSSLIMDSFFSYQKQLLTSDSQFSNKQVPTENGVNNWNNNFSVPTDINFTITPFTQTSYYQIEWDYSNYFLLKNLKLSNTVRYTNNFNPQSDVYLF